MKKPKYVVTDELVDLVGVENAIVVSRIAFKQLSDYESVGGKRWVLMDSSELKHWHRQKVQKLLRELEEKKIIVSTKLLEDDPAGRVKRYSIYDSKMRKIADGTN